MCQVGTSRSRDTETIRQTYAHKTLKGQQRNEVYTQITGWQKQGVGMCRIHLAVNDGVKEKDPLRIALVEVCGLALISILGTNRVDSKLCYLCSLGITVISFLQQFTQHH